MKSMFGHALNIQIRALWALSLREIHGRHGKLRIGYLWQIIRVAFNIGVFWAIREYSNFQAPSGLSTPIFLLTGFTPWFIFSESVSKVMEAVRTNLALLTFPQITPLDLCLSGAIVTAATQFIVMIIFIVIVLLLGIEVHLYDPFLFVVSLFGISLFGFAVGLFLLSVSLYIPLVETLTPMVMRILFFTTGVFFSPSQFDSFGDIVMWLPSANYIEILRDSFTPGGLSEYIKFDYTLLFTFFLLAIGLLLERHVRALHDYT